MNFVEKKFHKITNYYYFEQTLLLRGGQVEILCKGDFIEGTEVFYKGPDGPINLQDDLWDLENGYSFRTSQGKITEIIEPKKEIEEMKEFKFEEIKFETEEEKVFISECIKGVMDGGEATDTEQAYAICKTKYDEKLAEIPVVEVEEPEIEVPAETKIEEPSNDLQKTVDTLTEQVNSLTEKLLKIEEMLGGFSKQENLEKFQTEIDERIKKISGSIPFEKFDIEDNLTDYDRFLNKYKK